MTRVFASRCGRGTIPLLALLATLACGGATLVRCSGNETGSIASHESTGPLQISFADLKLDVSREKLFTPSVLTGKIKSLDGKTIRIRGYILPSYESYGITKFVLVQYSDYYLADGCIIVDLVSPATVDFTNHAIDVEGILTLREFKTPEGEVLAIYHLDGKKTERVPNVGPLPSKYGC